MAECVRQLSPAHCKAPPVVECAKPCVEKCEKKVVIETCEKPCEKPCGYGWGGWGFGHLLAVYIVLVIIIWVILWFVKPSWAYDKDVNGNSTGQINWGKLLLSALGIALIVLFVLWLLALVFGAGRFY